MDYEVERRTFLPHYGEGEYDVIVDGGISELVMEITEAFYEDAPPYGLLVGKCLVEGEEFYFLFGDRDLMVFLAPLRFRLPVKCRISLDPDTALYKVEEVK